MVNNNFDQKIWQHIKHLAPRPRWQFLLKDYLIWISAILALLVGSLSFSVIVYLFSGNDWSVIIAEHLNWLQWLLLILPYFWLLLIVLLIFLIYYNIKHTQRGWRYPWSLVAGLSIIFSLLLGVLFFQAGWGRVIDDTLSQGNRPMYAKIFNPRLDFWSQPEEGRLIGLLADEQADNLFIIIDSQQQSWQVDISQAKIMTPDNLLQLGLSYKLSGYIVKDNYFMAEEVMPMDFGRRFFDRRIMFDRPDFAKRPGPLPGLFAKHPEVKPDFIQHLQECPDCFCQLLQDRPNFWEEISNMPTTSEMLAILINLKNNCQIDIK